MLATHENVNILFAKSCRCEALDEFTAGHHCSPTASAQSLKSVEINRSPWLTLYSPSPSPALSSLSERESDSPSCQTPKFHLRASVLLNAPRHVIIELPSHSSLASRSPSCGSPSLVAWSRAISVTHRAPRAARRVPACCHARTPPACLSVPARCDSQGPEIIRVELDVLPPAFRPLLTALVLN